MLKLKTNLLEQLKCKRCDGYLDVAPIMITSDKCQICGKCYKILPLEDREVCVRQVAYEAVAEMLLFPCRYNVYGCKFQSAFNKSISHEAECSFRLDASQLEEISEDIYEEVLFYDSGSFVSGSEAAQCKSKLNSPIKFTILDTSQNIVVESTYVVGKYPSIIKYNTCIYANEVKGSALLLTTAKYNNNIRNPIKICVEGAISSHTFQSVYCKVTMYSMNDIGFSIKRNNEAEYTNLKSLRDLPKCVKCYEVVKKEVYYCSYGHDVCSSCKGATCILCTSPINLVPRYHCANFTKGCLVYLIHSELYLHSKDCEFNTILCPIDKECGECGTLLHLKQHIKNYHRIDDKSSVTRTSSTNDEIWIMTAYDNIFKCKFFYYEHQVEILVEVIGSHKIAEQFKYEVLLQPQQTNKTVLKSAKCAKWQTSALEDCVLLTQKDFQQVKFNMKAFVYNLTIYRTKP